MSIKIMPISDLRREASRILDLLRREGDPVYITHYGRPVAVMVDYERYEAVRVVIPHMYLLCEAFSHGRLTQNSRHVL